MKKAKLAIMLGMFSLVLGLLCIGVFASQSVSYGLNGTITYKVENNIEATSNALSLSATANCSHVSATSGTGVTGSNISNYFKVIYNGAEQNQTQITSLISSGTLVVSTSNVTVSSGLVKMSNVSSSASTSQSLSLSLKFSDSSAVTKTGTGTITRTSAGTETKNVSSGNCITFGYSGDECCKNCGTVVTEGSTTTYGSHNYKTTQKQIYPTYHEDGIWAQYTCSICKKVTGGGTITRTHASYEYYSSGKSATCTSSGYSAGSYCSKGCYDYRTTTEALGHDWEWTTDTYATCTSSGTEHQYCTRCSATQSTGTTINKLGHDYQENGSITYSAETGGDEDGIYYYHDIKTPVKCSRCGSTSTWTSSASCSMSSSYLGYGKNSNGHWKRYQYSCADCSNSYVETADFASHTYVASYCTVCGYH